MREKQFGLGVSRPVHMRGNDIRLDVKSGTVDINDLLDKLRSDGLVSVYKCPS